MASNESGDPDKYEELEKELWKLVQADPYLSSIPDLQQEEIQTLGHFTSVRDTSELLPDTDAVESTFDLHSRALQRMTSIGSCLLTTATEWSSNRKAIQKAKEMEKKAREKEESKLRKKAQKAEQKRLEAERKKNEQTEGNQDDSKGDGKRRRVGGTRIASQMSDSDPKCLVEKFDEMFKIDVVEELELWLQYIYIYHIFHTSIAYCPKRHLIDYCSTDSGSGRESI